MDEISKEGVPEPADEFRISDLETLKVLSDPLRFQLVEQLLEGPRTVKQLAKEMGVPPTKLYYHVNLLEERGIIRVVSTRIVSGIIEKQYYVTAHSYPVDRSLLSPAGSGGGEGFPQVVQATLDHTARDIARSFHAGLIDLSTDNPEARSLVALRIFAQLTRRQARDFATRLEALLRELNNTRPPEGASEGAEDDVRVYGLTVAFYPSHLRSIPHPKKKETENG